MTRNQLDDVIAKQFDAAKNKHREILFRDFDSSGPKRRDADMNVSKETNDIVQEYFQNACLRTIAFFEGQERRRGARKESEICNLRRPS